MSNRCGFFVTGTDTGVGKTVVTLGLMQVLQQQGRSVAAMKPVAAGCEMTTAGLRHADALQLQQQASIELDYEQVNPYAFAPAIAPHVAADQVGALIAIEDIINIYNKIRYSADCTLVEGVGGWLVPLNDHQTLANLARELGLGVILVVGLRLGCLNHALLTAASIRASGCTLAGWVANRLPGETNTGDANIHALQARLGCPLLGRIPLLPDASAKRVAEYLTVLLN